MISATTLVTRVAPVFLVALASLLQSASAQVPIPSEYVSVGDYTGTANERINAAIAAAMATDHKTVYFPNGTYALRSGLNLQQGPDTTLHLIGESRDGVFLIPDIPYLEANYNGGDWQNGGARLAHMINLSRTSDFIIFNSVDVSIQNMTIDMRHPGLVGVPVTYNVVGHGIRVGTGWATGQFTVNHVNIRNVGSYGVGIQDRDGHPKNNITLENMIIERAGSDGVDTKEASGDGNRNLVIRNVHINEVGFFDTGAAPALDLRYRDVTIENVNIVSKSNQGINGGQSTTGINFRPWDNGPGTGIVGATVTNAYIRGTAVGMRIHADNSTPHANIAISDFRIQGQNGAGIDILGTNHSGHTISDGFVDPAFGGAPVVANGQAVVSNVAAARWDPALTPQTNTTFESNVSLAGDTYSPAWVGMVGSERVALNPTSPSAGPFVFDVGNTGVMRIDYDGTFNVMDKLIVDGTLNLDGELRVSTIGGAPSAPGTYQLFEADTITGSFDAISLPAVTGLVWVTENLATDGTLSLQLPSSSSIFPTNTGSHVVAGSLGNSSTSFSFNAGPEADMLMVAVSTERSTETIPTLSYGGHALTPAIEETQAGIWYLDLATTNYQGGAANLAIDFTGINVVNGVAIGAVSVSTSGRSIELHATATGTESANLVTTRGDAFAVASFNANGSGSPSVNAPFTTIYANGNIGSAQGAAGYQVNVAAGTHPINWTTGNKRRVAAAAFVIANTFSNWMAGYESVTAIGFNNDPDGDRLPNGIEAWFGTHPGEFSRGLIPVAGNGTELTFTHPQSDFPPSDLELRYRWSPNLVDWYNCDGVDGPVGGETVSTETNTDANTTTVTAITSQPMERFFLSVTVGENP